jgi:hypothetical protein
MGRRDVLSPAPAAACEGAECRSLGVYVPAAPIEFLARPREGQPIRVRRLCVTCGIEALAHGERRGRDEDVIEGGGE